MQLGIDLGTSAVKAVLIDGERLVASASSDEIRRTSPRPGWSEQDPRDWWQAVRQAVGRLGEEADLGAVGAVGLSGQMHGLVALGADGGVLRSAILWNDNRAAAEADELALRVPDIETRAGVRPLPGLTAPKMLWLARNEPAVHARIRHVLLPKDWLAFRLTGGTVGTDASDAAGTLWLDQAARSWDMALAAASETDLAWLPPISDGSVVVGEVPGDVAGELGLTPGTPVVAGAGDAAAGAVALGAVEEGRGFLSLGTSGQLLVADASYRPTPGRLIHAFAHTIPGRWYRMAAMLNGARPLAWFASVVGRDVGSLLAEAEAADPARVPVFLPYLTGERSPHGNPHVRAGFHGLEDAAGRGEMARAVAEAVAFAVADCAASFGDGAGIPDPLPVVGGGARSPFLLRLVASVLGRPVAPVEGAEVGPALGAARLAAHGSGQLTRSDLARPARTGPAVEPASLPGLAQRLDAFRDLYRRLADFRIPVAGGSRL